MNNINEDAWRRLVLERSNNVCSGCGGSIRLQVHFVVPLEAGGTLTSSNGYVLCRTCEIAREISRKQSTHTRRPINFWASQYLYQLLESHTGSGHRFGSMGDLIRYLIDLYNENPERFDDLGSYQDRGTETKINAWVDQDAYKKFKGIVDSRNMTVTDALKGLVLLYSELESKEKEIQ